MYNGPTCRLLVFASTCVQVIESYMQQDVCFFVSAATNMQAAIFWVKKLEWPAELLRGRWAAGGKSGLALLFGLNKQQRKSASLGKKNRLLVKTKIVGCWLIRLAHVLRMMMFLIFQTRARTKMVCKSTTNVIMVWRATCLELVLGHDLWA
jgi:hypothetical protein